MAQPWHNPGTTCAKPRASPFAMPICYNAAMSRDSELTPKQAAFVAEYLQDYNGTQAALRAGYAPSGAHVQAQRLLNNANVRTAIEAGQHEAAARNEVTVDRIIQEYARIAFANTTDFINIIDGSAVAEDTDAMPSNKTAAIAEIAQTKDGVRIKLHSKQAALDSLGKHLGMFVERIKDETPVDDTPAQIIVHFGAEPEDGE